MAKVKICGLTREEDINIVNCYQPDYIGFVFAESKRKVTKEKAARLKRQLDTNIQAVGVFVNTPIQDILDLCNENIIDMIQLHGNEKEDYILELKNKLPHPIIKALRPDSKENIEKSLTLHSDYLLVDTYIEGQFGGSGRTFDWSILPGKAEKIFLAGGLNAGNAEDAILTCRPYCLDVSSGVETDGRKDALKVKAFIDIVRNVSQNINKTEE